HRLRGRVERGSVGGEHVQPDCRAGPRHETHGHVREAHRANVHRVYHAHGRTVAHAELLRLRGDFWRGRKHEAVHRGVDVRLHARGTDREHHTAEPGDLVGFDRDG